MATGTSRRNTHMNEVDSDLLILNERLMGYIQVGMDNAVDVGQNISEYCSDDESMKEKLRTTMAEFINMENDIKHHIKALTHVKSVNTQSEDSLITIFQNKLQQVQSVEQDIKNHTKFLELEEKLSGDRSIEEQLDILRASLVGGTSGDDELAMSVEINIKCPITGQTMVDPVRNRACNHVYDKNGILSYINSRKSKAKCPIGGCDNAVRVENLEDHKDMMKYINILRKKRPSKDNKEV